MSLSLSGAGTSFLTSGGRANSRRSEYLLRERAGPRKLYINVFTQLGRLYGRCMPLS